MGLFKTKSFMERLEEDDSVPAPIDMSKDEYKEFQRELTDKDRFETAMKHTLVAEGGDAFIEYNNAAGGDTKFGIAQRYNPDIDVKNLTETEAKRIAYDRYWKKPKIDMIPNDSLQAHVFDAYYLAGKKGIRAFQNALKEAGADIDPDGFIGDDTVRATKEALEKVSEQELHRLIAENRIREFEKIKKTSPENYNKFIKGWTNRAFKMFEIYGEN
jgi:lysozyme family protein